MLTAVEHCSTTTAMDDFDTRWERDQEREPGPRNARPSRLDARGSVRVATARAHERCEGCDEDGHALASYVVTNHEGTKSSARYCADCAALARAGWNGETAAIEPEAESADALTILRNAGLL